MILAFALAMLPTASADTLVIGPTDLPVIVELDAGLFMQPLSNPWDWDWLPPDFSIVSSQPVFDTTIFNYVNTVNGIHNFEVASGINCIHRLQSGPNSISHPGECTDVVAIEYDPATDTLTFETE